MHLTNRINGFTLIELLITISIAVILLTAAAPSFTSMIRDNRIITQTNNLVASLQLARSEAAKRSVQVTIRSKSGVNNNWDQGWSVFTDWDGNGSFNDNGNAVLCEVEEDCELKVQHSLPNNLTLRTGRNYTTWLAYLPSGTTISSVGSGDDKFRICASNGTKANARLVDISATGRPAIAAGASTCP